MIEIKINFSTVAEAAQFLACVTEPARSGAAKPGVAATLSPEAQQAARDSVAQGTAAGATGKPAKASKADKAPAPAPEPSPAPPAEPKAIAYPDSGLPEAITKANAKDSAATKAVLEKYNARNAEGKLKGSAIPADKFAEALADFNAIIDKPADDSVSD